MNQNRENISVILDQLKANNALWSYDCSSDNVSDELLIEKTLIYLDLPYINQLIDIYGKNKVKKVWNERLVPQSDYLYSLNRFLAWYYFNIKKPDAYLKRQETIHLKNLVS